MRDTLCGEDPRAALDAKFRALLDYSDKLTRTPSRCEQADVDTLREFGASDAEISATVQVSSYFNYINRVADGLGVDLEPEMLADAEDESA